MILPCGTSHLDDMVILRISVPAIVRVVARSARTGFIAGVGWTPLIFRLLE
jgi:hypothetical protein